MVQLPRLIAICGNPKSGKSEVQRILERTYSYIPIDDGECLRDFAISNLGLSIKDVYTQEGKARFTEILGKTWQNRDILGTFGAKLEEMFGEHIMAWVATRHLDPNKRYSFGSVRKNQGVFYKSQGGMVVEVVNPSAQPSPYEFDRYNRAIIDYKLLNDPFDADGELRPAARRNLEVAISDMLVGGQFDTRLRGLEAA